MPTVLAVALLLGGHAHAQVARVNGIAIPQAYMDVIVQAQTARGQPDSPELRNGIKDTLINQEVLAQEALRRGLDKNPNVAAQIALQRQEILVNAFVQDYIKSNPVSDEAVRKEYERQKAAVGNREYKARHILVEKEEEAKEAIAQIRKGVPFEKVAGERSRDQGTRVKGGELDWAIATNYLKKGQITDTPVQSPFGWHVIRLDDERPFKAPPFDDVKANMQRGLQQVMVQKYVMDLRAKAKVE
jgi:peptidyl-prolyl cis-trans isomerase C